MQLLALLMAFISTTSALALPGIQSSITNWVQNRRIRIADEQLTAGFQSFKVVLAKPDSPSFERDAAKANSQMTEGAKHLKSAVELHTSRQDKLQGKIDAAKKAGDFKKAMELQTRKERKNNEMAQKMSALHDKFGQMLALKLN